MERRSTIRAVGCWVGALALAGLAGWVVLQHRTISRLSEENRKLAGNLDELDRLRAEVKAAQNLRRQEAELQQLREDNRDLLRLRSEVHQLREQQKETELLRTANARLLQALQGLNLSTNQLAMVAAARKEGAVLGILLRSVNDAQNGAVPPRYNGAVVAQFEPDSPVASSGLMVGDIIIRADGRPIENPGQLQAEMLTKKPGDIVTLDVMRNDTLIRVRVQTRAWPK